MLQSIVLCSRKRFQITKQGDPLDLLAWFLNSLHIALNGTKKRDSSEYDVTVDLFMEIFYSIKSFHCWYNLCYSVIEEYCLELFAFHQKYNFAQDQLRFLAA